MKKILNWICNIICIPIELILALGLVWYVLPAIRTCAIGTFVSSIIPNPTTFMWIIIGCAAVFVALLVIKLLIGKSENIKIRNLFIHLHTWLICLAIAGLAGATFFLCEDIVMEHVVISFGEKIALGGLLLVFIGYTIFAEKLAKVINRRIQAYETAKELNEIGRGNVIWTNLLKLFEVLCPEFIVLAILACCTSWALSVYFMLILAASLIPTIGNIICDFIIRAKIRRDKIADKAATIQQIAQAVKGSK